MKLHCLFFVVIIFVFVQLSIQSTYNQQAIPNHEMIFPILSQNVKGQKSPPVSEKINEIKYPIFFYPNSGQNEDQNVKYICNLHSKGIWFFTNESIVYGINEDYQIQMKLIGANFETTKPLLKRKSVSHYYLGKFKATDIENYSGVKYENIYSNIDLEFHINDETGNLKSSFVLDRAADMSQIQWKYETKNEALTMTISESNGNLQFYSKSTNSLIFEESKPVFFQNNRQLEGDFILDEVNGVVTFQIDKNYNFNEEEALVIDPNYATYVGGNKMEKSNNAIQDEDGCVIVIGSSKSTNFEITISKFPFVGSGDIEDVLVFKFCGDKQEIRWSLFLGSSLCDRAWAIDFDGNGDLIIGGYTDGHESSNTTPFPTTSGVIEQECSDQTNQGTVFITKLRNDGTDIIWSTLICSAHHSTLNSLKYLPGDNKIVIGGFSNANFPQNGYNASKHSCLSKDTNKVAFIGLVDNEGTDLERVTCLKPNSQDNLVTNVEKISVVNNEYIYFGGWIEHTSGEFWESPDCPVKRDPLDDLRSILVGRVHLSNFTYDYACAYGGDGTSNFYDMEFDSEGNMWVVGSSEASNFVTTGDALLPTKPSGLETSLFGNVFKLDSKLTTILYSTWIYKKENPSAPEVRSIAIGSNDEVMISVRNFFPTQSMVDHNYGVDNALFVLNKQFDQFLVNISNPLSYCDRILLYNGDIYNFTLMCYGSSPFNYPSENAYQEEQNGEDDIQLISLNWKCGTGNYTTREGCFPCSTGKFNDEAVMANECEKCPRGTYQELEGQSFCRECALGSFTSRLGQTSCQNCSVGTFANVTKLTQCHDCGLGTYAGELGLSECLGCVPGTYGNKTGLSACEDCSSGYYSGGVGSSACDICESGTYSDTDGSTGCTKCYPGSYQNTQGQTKCIHCPEGQYAGGKGNHNCTDCEVGTHQPNQWTTSCERCSRGYYQDEEGAIDCPQCPPGTISPNTGSPACQPCTEGTYAHENRIECIPCPAGTFNNKTSGDSIDACEPCPVLTYNPKTGSKSIEACIRCENGFWSETVGAITESVCIPCGKGTYLDPNDLDGECKTCELGYYSPKIASTSCMACPEGTTSSSNFQKYVSCGSGTYAEGEANPQCNKCEKGTFNNGTKQTACKKCLHPEYCLGGDTCASGRNPQKQCEKCKEGFFELNKSCQKCPTNLQYLYLLILIVAFIILLFVFKKKVQRKILEDPFPVFRIVVTFVQIISLLFTLKLSWPETVSGSISKWGTIFVFDLNVLASPDCYSQLSWKDKWVLQFMTPLIIISILLAVYLALNRYYKSHGLKEEQKEFGIFFSRLFSLTLKYFFIPMSNISFQPFNYTTDPETNEKVLSIDPSISTSSTTYKKYLTLYILSIIIYIVGIPLFFIIVLLKAKKANFSKFWADRFGWIFLNYKSNRYWFEIFEIFIKFFLAISSLFFANDDDGISQRNYFLLSLFVVALLLMIYLKPYQVDVTFDHGKFAAEDKAQIGFYIMIIGAITLALQQLNNILFVILWPLGAIISFVGLYSSYQKMKEKKAKSKIKFSAKAEIKKQEKMLRKFTKKQTFSDLHLLSLNQQIIKSIKESVSVEKDLLRQIKQLDDKIQILQNNYTVFNDEKLNLLKEREENVGKMGKLGGENDD
ncbi:insulin-like growth factor binding proteinn-terminal [Anaeramoeba flamelloides]|uniref:Insulin-like growth factor binding proteinn-terminal n=1 Tax=Anaeramoeba flamelloides TaxID=1746091 RepID=A0AAV7ZFF1_9EUKA|nr:insulin-like growth factor binding proteinn-terminal [Anaeramoeba flamelloides]